MLKCLERHLGGVSAFCKCNRECVMKRIVVTSFGVLLADFGGQPKLLGSY